MNWVRKKKHQRRRSEDEGSQYPLPDPNTKKNEVEIRNEDRFRASALEPKPTEQWEGPRKR